MAINNAQSSVKLITLTQHYLTAARGISVKRSSDKLAKFFFFSFFFLKIQATAKLSFNMASRALKVVVTRYKTHFSPNFGE